MAPSKALLQTIQQHKWVSPFAYNWDNLVALNECIFKVIELNTHGIHVIEVKQEWCIHWYNMKNDSS